MKFLATTKQRGIAVGISLAIVGIILLIIWRKKIWGIFCECGQGYIGDDDCGCGKDAAPAASSTKTPSNTPSVSAPVLTATTTQTQPVKPQPPVTVKPPVAGTEKQFTIKAMPQRNDANTVYGEGQTGASVGAIVKQLNRFISLINPKLDSPAMMDALIGKDPAAAAIIRRMKEAQMQPNGASITAAGKLGALPQSNTLSKPAARVLYILLGTTAGTLRNVEAAVNTFYAATTPVAAASQTISAPRNLV